MAQRQRVQNAEGMDQPLPAQIRLRTFRDGTYAGQHVAVGENNALGIAGGAGCEEDLERGLARKPSEGPGFFGW